MTEQLVQQGISQIFAGDKRRLDEVLSGQGWRYVMAAIMIFPLTLIKVFYFLFSNKHLFHKVKETPLESRQGVGLSTDFLKNSARTIYTRENIESTNDEVWRAKEPYDKKEQEKREQKLSAISYLRNQLESNVRIEGTVLKTTHHKVSDKNMLESAQTGSMRGRFITQKITFGNEVNASLKILFPTLRVRRVKGSENTFIDFENDEVFELEQKLRNLFMKPVTLIIKRKRNEK